MTSSASHLSGTDAAPDSPDSLEHWVAERDAFLATLVRRGVDIVAGSLLLVLFAPLLIVVGILIRIESRGPALYRQTRLGIGGRRFTLYKLRGMYSDARERWPELYEYRYSADELAVLRFHPERDPRVTRVGRFIRRTSIDELPNLFNVLRGDMSLVGPRPEIPEMIPYYGPSAAAVLSVKPGITSLAKCSGRDGLDFYETMRLDVEYTRRRSLRLDAQIVWATVRTVILQHGVLPG